MIAEANLEIELLAFVHVRRDIAEARRFHDLELCLEDARRVLVLVGPLEPDRHGNALELLKVFDWEPIDLVPAFSNLAHASMSAFWIAAWWIRE